MKKILDVSSLSQKFLCGVDVPRSSQKFLCDVGRSPQKFLDKRRSL
ncbi:MAG: hypothetical protein SR1Q7_09385 [Quinella sp. 1Q7]|nr:hypothetical protein [Quinella sp. 1Q7]